MSPCLHLIGPSYPMTLIGLRHHLIRDKFAALGLRDASSNRCACLVIEPNGLARFRGHRKQQLGSLQLRGFRQLAHLRDRFFQQLDHLAILTCAADSRIFRAE
jgi:hypothetical protein